MCWMRSQYSVGVFSYCTHACARSVFLGLCVSVSLSVSLYLSVCVSLSLLYMCASPPPSPPPPLSLKPARARDLSHACIHTHARTFPRVLPQHTPPHPPTTTTPAFTWSAGSRRPRHEWRGASPAGRPSHPRSRARSASSDCGRNRR